MKHIIVSICITFVFLVLSAAAETGAVYVQGDIISGQTLNKLMSDVAYTKLNTEIVQGKKLDSLVVVLITPGGSVVEAEAMFHYLRSLARDDIKIYTVASGVCASAGMILLQAGDVRYGCDHTYYMTHKPFAYVNDYVKTDDARKLIKNIDTMNYDIIHLFAERMKVEPQRIAKYFTDVEYGMTAEDAYRIGFIDKVIYSAKDIARNE